MAAVMMRCATRFRSRFSGLIFVSLLLLISLLLIIITKTKTENQNKMCDKMKLSRKHTHVRRDHHRMDPFLNFFWVQCNDPNDIPGVDQNKR